MGDVPGKTQLLCASSTVKLRQIPDIPDVGFLAGKQIWTQKREKSFNGKSNWFKRES